MSDVTKAKNAALLAVAVIPRIQDTVDVVQNKIDSQTYVNRLVADYTGYSMNDNNFVASRLARGWAPIAGSLVLGKAIGIIRKRYRM